MKVNRSFQYLRWSIVIIMESDIQSSVYFKKVQAAGCELLRVSEPTESLQIIIIDYVFLHNI